MTAKLCTQKKIMKQKNTKKYKQENQAHITANKKGVTEIKSSYEVVSFNIKDLIHLGFDVSEITHSEMDNIANKMDLSEEFWRSLEHTALKYGLKKK